MFNIRVSPKEFMRVFLLPFLLATSSICGAEEAPVSDALELPTAPYREEIPPPRYVGEHSSPVRTDSAKRKGFACFRSPLCVGGIILLGIGSLVAADNEIHREMVQARRGRLGAVLGQGFGQDGSLLDRLGGTVGFVVVPGLFYTGGLLTGSERARRVGVTSVEAVIVTGIVVQGTHRLFGRGRPDDPNLTGTRGFRPLRSSGYFPSGHTNVAFAVAAVVAEEYDSFWIDFTAYGMASVVGFSRIYQERHFAADVAAGAALGIFGGKLVSRWENKKGWLSSLYSDGQGIFFRKKF